MSPIADMLIRIKNAQATGAGRVEVPFSKSKFTIANILKSTGYLESVERTAKKDKKTEHDYLELGLRYVEGTPAIDGIRIMSRPSRHLYVKSSDIRPVRSGHGIALFSTSQGIMTSADARKQKLGGEILFEIW